MLRCGKEEAVRKGQRSRWTARVLWLVAMLAVAVTAGLPTGA